MKLKPRRLPVPYSRTENNGYCSMLTNNGDSNYTMCNSTSMKILDMCNGEKTVEQFLCTLVELYPEVEKSRAERDLIHTLSNFTRLNAIEWKDDDGMSNNPFVLTAVGHIDEQVSIRVCDSPGQLLMKKHGLLHIEYWLMFQFRLESHILQVYQ